MAVAVAVVAVAVAVAVAIIGSTLSTVVPRHVPYLGPFPLRTRYTVHCNVLFYDIFNL